MKHNFIGDLTLIIRGNVEISSPDNIEEVEDQIREVLRKVRATILHEDALEACPTIDTQSLHVSKAIPQDISIFDD